MALGVGGSSNDAPEAKDIPQGGPRRTLMARKRSSTSNTGLQDSETSTSSAFLVRAPAHRPLHYRRTANHCSSWTELLGVADVFVWWLGAATG